MTTQPTHPAPAGALRPLDPDAHRMFLLELENFNKLLEEPPPIEHISVRERITYKNTDGTYRPHYYIPIDILETEVMKVFGAFQTVNFRWHTIANEVTGAIDVLYWHPIFQTWLTISGAGAVMIQQKANSKPSDYDAKYTNALESAMPHLISDCFTNAVAKLGRRFGRGLNRDPFKKGEYKPTGLNSVEAMQEVEAKKQLLARSIEVLELYKGKISDYTDRNTLHLEGPSLLDEAKKEGLLDDDFQTFRGLLLEHYMELKAKEEKAIEAPVNGQKGKSNTKHK